MNNPVTAHASTDLTARGLFCHALVTDKNIQAIIYREESIHA